MEVTITLHNLEETNAFAKVIASFVFPGMVIGLSGDLGSGKTTFTRFLATHLEVKGTVNSPTFTILKTYEGKYPLYHMDVYRLAESGYDFELDDFLYGSGVSVVEWVSIIDNYLEKPYLEIDFSIQGESRIVNVKGSGRYESILQALNS